MDYLCVAEPKSQQVANVFLRVEVGLVPAQVDEVLTWTRYSNRSRWSYLACLRAKLPSLDTPLRPCGVCLSSRGRQHQGDLHAGEALQHAPFVAQGPPIIEVNFERTPHGDPATDCEALFENFGGGAMAECAD
jgi:hypothetical protein